MRRGEFFLQRSCAASQSRWVHGVIHLAYSPRLIYHAVERTHSLMMQLSDTTLVTGGAGFIGSNFVLSWLKNCGSPVVNLDLLTYAGNPSNLDSLKDDHRHLLVHGDICDQELIRSLLREHRPRTIVHFAAESHVDRSIVAPDAFIRTNVQGTFTLLEQAKFYWSELDDSAS